MPDTHVLGVVPDRATAEQVIANVRAAGFPQQDVSIIMAQREPEPDRLDQEADQTGEGAKDVAKHAAAGAGVGGALGIGVGLASMAIPGVGPVVGAGAIISLLTGGSVVGGLAGAFSSENETEQVIQRYGMALREGQAIVSVTAHDAETAKQAQELLRRYDVANINSYLGDLSDPAQTPGITEQTPRTDDQQ